MTVAVGSPVPDFTGLDDEGNRFSFADTRGRSVVLHFFVLAWSGL
jgi:peroxiredoxin